MEMAADDADLEQWGIPLKPSSEQKFIWRNMVATWKRFSGRIPEPSLDIGAASSKDRTVSVDPFPRGRVDIRAIGEALPFVEGHFTSVVLESVIKHVLSPKQTLEEAKRVMRPGSFLFLTSPVNHTDSHRHSFSAKQLCNLIENSGFRIIRKMGLGFSVDLFDGLFRRRASRFYSRLQTPVKISRTMFVVAEKK